MELLENFTKMETDSECQMEETFEVGEYVRMFRGGQKYIVKILSIGKHPNYDTFISLEQYKGKSPDEIENQYGGVWVAVHDGYTPFWMQVEDIEKAEQDEIMMHLLTV